MTRTAGSVGRTDSVHLDGFSAVSLAISISRRESALQRTQPHQPVHQRVRLATLATGQMPTALLTRLADPAAARRAEAHVLLAEMGSALELLLRTLRRCRRR